MGKVTNIEYGNIEKCYHRKMLTSKAVTSNLASTYLTSTVKTGSKRGPRGVGGPLLMMIGDAMTPFDPTGGPV